MLEAVLAVFWFWGVTAFRGMFTTRWHEHKKKGGFLSFLSGRLSSSWPPVGPISVRLTALPPWSISCSTTRLHKDLDCTCAASLPRTYHHLKAGPRVWRWGERSLQLSDNKCNSDEKKKKSHTHNALTQRHGWCHQQKARDEQMSTQGSDDRFFYLVSKCYKTKAAVRWWCTWAWVQEELTKRTRCKLDSTSKKDICRDEKDALGDDKSQIISESDLVSNMYCKRM